MARALSDHRDRAGHLEARRKQTVTMVTGPLYTDCQGFILLSVFMGWRQMEEPMPKVQVGQGSRCLPTFPSPGPDSRSPVS